MYESFRSSHMLHMFEVNIVSYELITSRDAYVCVSTDIQIRDWRECSAGRFPLCWIH
jgi:hypothetical protein